MMKRMIFLALGLIIFLLLSTGCNEPDENGDNSKGGNEDSQSNIALFENLSELEAYLAGSKLNTHDNPIPVKVNIYMPSAWSLLIDTLFRAGRYVELDLSNSTGITTFNPGTANTGEHLIVSLVLPNVVTNIYDGSSNIPTFARFSVLKRISGNNVKTIGEYCFYNRATLEIVDFPALVNIGRTAFGSCTGLTSITLPNSVTTIGNSAFYNCTGLTNITIPDNVTTIDSGAFAGCIGLISITVNSGNTNYSSEGGILYNKAKTILIRTPGGINGSVELIPNSVTAINDSAFSGCTGLTSIVIPNSVTAINDSAFSGCTGLTSIVIPNSVTTINGSAFWGCTGLTSITIPNNVTSIGSSAFSGCTVLQTVIFNGSPSLDNYDPFPGNLESVYEGQGTYTTTNPGGYDAVWTKVE